MRRKITDTLLVAVAFAGLTANFAGQAQQRMDYGGHAAVLQPAAMPRVADGVAVEPDISGGVAAAVQTAAADVAPERVDYWIKRFTTDQRTSFETYLERMKAFEPLINAKLDERGMPHDLVYLAMIESGFNPAAQSPAQAKGLWQFIASTAERYGLTVNRKVDERVDPEKSTEAALTYLSDLYQRFGSWYLAAAAYNSGENRVARVMRQVTGSEQGSDSDFDLISARLPKETQDYVPRIIAAARIAQEPEKYGFTEGQS